MRFLICSGPQLPRFQISMPLMFTAMIPPDFSLSMLSMRSMLLPWQSVRAPFSLYSPPAVMFTAKPSDSTSNRPSPSLSYVSWLARPSSLLPATVTLTGISKLPPSVDLSKEILM